MHMKQYGKKRKNNIVEETEKRWLKRDVSLTGKDWLRKENRRSSNKENKEKRG